MRRILVLSPAECSFVTTRGYFFLMRCTLPRSRCGCHYVLICEGCDVNLPYSQNNAVVSAIESQTLLITAGITSYVCVYHANLLIVFDYVAENGWPFHSKDFVDQALTLESKV